MEEIFNKIKEILDTMKGLSVIEYAFLLNKIIEECNARIEAMVEDDNNY